MLLLTDDELLSVLVANRPTLRVVIVLVVTVSAHLYQPLLIACIDLALNRTFPEPAPFVPVTPVFKSNQQLHKFPTSMRKKLEAYFFANTDTVIVDPAVNDCEV